MDRILIEALEIETIIGVHDWERTTRQRVVIDLDMGVDTISAAASDNLGDTVSYGDVARAVTGYVEQTDFELIEALAEQTAALILERFPVADVRLKLAKPGAVANASRVAIIVERRRAP